MKTLYKTITIGSIDYFDKEVSKHLEQGWELYGNPYTTGWREMTKDTSNYWHIYYCQALIKKIGKEEYINSFDWSEPQPIPPLQSLEDIENIENI